MASFLLPREDSADRIGRLAALGVAPGLTPAALTQALRARIDPSFCRVPAVRRRLPRSAAGKLPSQAAQDLLATLQARPRPGCRHERARRAPAHRRGPSRLCRALSRPAYPSRGRAAG